MSWLLVVPLLDEKRRSPGNFPSFSTGAIAQICFDPNFILCPPLWFIYALPNFI
ncbi:hypothetical protein [Fortiea contorta]|uniref:hypothetical protein n=1 Tax=Fortiea contorta TaxID=1892405 RepID=UPI00034B1156|nr:hypothetical protein [Fortiea contorta]